MSTLSCSLSVVNQYRKRVVRDSSILSKKVILEVVYRTLRCTHCNRVGTEKIDFLSDNGFRVSRRLEMEVIEDLESRLYQRHIIKNRTQVG